MSTFGHEHHVMNRTFVRRFLAGIQHLVLLPLDAHCSGPRLAQSFLRQTLICQHALFRAEAC